MAVERTVSLVRDWLNCLAVSKALAPQTVALYDRLCSSFVDECVQGREVERVTTAEIEAWLQRPRLGRALGRRAAPATMHRDASTIRGFYGWAHAIGAVRENPAMLVCTPAVHNRQPRPVSDATFTKLWDTLDGADAIVLGLAFFCDRARFLIGWSDLGRPRRSVAASLREADALDPNHLNHWLDRMVSRARVPHIAPHQLRHSCATNLLRAGVPLPIASNLLNHANVHTTMRYMKAGGDELREWLTRTTPPNRLSSRRDHKSAAIAGAYDVC